ncbi:MAG: hypothetical protein K1X74_18225 [Pirellulales bacterium]|nr:hypothetical protein [Pirellulales bacterium]
MQSATWLKGSAAASVLVVTVLAAPVWGVDWFDAFKAKRPEMFKDPGFERWTKEVDWLERQVETYGSVVPKHVDLWGEARLTAHRVDFEEQMFKDLCAFEAKINGSIRRADTAATALAFQLGAGLDGTPAPSSVAAEKLIKDFEPIPLPQQKEPLPTPTLEPTTFILQKKRYLDLLNELRRINEGDDVTDAPGYALYLARLPVSVLPGKKTDKGHGAEITFTINPILSDELLPTTFERWVINDVARQLAFPLVKLLEDPAAMQVFIDVADGKVSAQEMRRARPDADSRAMDTPMDAATTAEAMLDELRGVIPADQIGAFQQGIAQMSLAAQALEIERLYKQIFPQGPFSLDDAERVPAPVREQPADVYTEDRNASNDRDGYVSRELQQTSQRVFDAAARGAVARWRDSLAAFPDTQILDIYGPSIIGVLAQSLRDVFAERAGLVHVADVQGHLRRELTAAYEFLKTQRTLPLWAHCRPELVAAVHERRRPLRANEYEPWKAQGISELARGSDTPAGPELLLDPSTQLGAPAEIHLYKLRGQFFHDVRLISRRANYTVTSSLAWAIIVDAALLNHRLQEEMQSTSIEKNCGCLPPLVWGDFYHPHPSPEARAAFNEFVRCRWPIQVFTVDPENDEQNIDDRLARRRELQLAVSLAVASGEMNASAAGRFLRRLDTEIAVIQLNRTTVGFSHGADTFGWRYYPRFQTPPSPGNLKAFAETLCGGPTTDQDLRQRKLEPGIRECVAMIVMPSFVPYCTLDSRSSWFSLTNPRNKELTVHEAAELSRTYQAVKQVTHQMCNLEAYRGVDVAGVQHVIDQLEHRLPIQTQTAHVPFENTLGGFATLADGATSLGPELYGWYGAPGVGWPSAGTPPNTHLFLIGENFSVLQTKVIAGGRTVTSKLLSRQVMKVEIPANPNVWSLGNREFVEVHVATPYGVSNHLEVPIHREGGNAAPAPEFIWKPAPAAVATLTWQMTPGQANLGCKDLVFHDCPAPEEKFLIKDLTGFGRGGTNAALLIHWSVVNKAGQTRTLSNPPAPQALTGGSLSYQDFVMLAQRDIRGSDLRQTDEPQKLVGEAIVRLNDGALCVVGGPIVIDVPSICTSGCPPVAPCSPASARRPATVPLQASRTNLPGPHAVRR